MKKGCLRIQKSVYLAKSSPAIMKDISQTLKEINEVYNNEDSIFYYLYQKRNLIILQ
ncbi:MAG: hypothetical protein IPI53_01165 [Saprospiraceae bacterium]|nr:hypothetical protein [Saprospiraceae bacterium]